MTDSIRTRRSSSIGRIQARLPHAGGESCAYAVPNHAHSRQQHDHIHYGVGLNWGLFAIAIVCIWCVAALRFRVDGNGARSFPRAYTQRNPAIAKVN